MLPLNVVRASDCASTAWSRERPTFEYRLMAQKPDWDQERREQRLVNPARRKHRAWACPEVALDAAFLSLVVRRAPRGDARRRIASAAPAARRPPTASSPRPIHSTESSSAPMLMSADTPRAASTFITTAR
jgi:hypothetical protein